MDRKLPLLVREKLGECLGCPVVYPSDCERLSLDIQTKINQVVGVTTLKRLFGFVNDVKQPRTATLDLLAKYAGYDSYLEMLRKLYGKGDSDFESLPDIDVANLHRHDKIRFTYLPDRDVTLEYLGNYRFEVVETKGSSLQKGDIIETTNLCLNQPLKATKVERDGNHLGRYVAGKVSGLTSLLIIPG